MSSTVTSTTFLAPEQLSQLEVLIDQGLLLQAHRLATRHGDYRQWRGAAAMVMASRLSAHLGAPRLGDALAYLGYRRYPESAETRLRYARFLLARRGQFRAWSFLQQFGSWVPENPALHAEWLSFSAYLFALLRDFTRSAACSERALALAPQDPWLLVERAYCLEQEDRFAEALDYCEQALRLTPGSRPALIQAAMLEVQLNREKHALERLRSGADASESSGLCAQLVDLLIEVGELDEAEHWLARAETLSPLLEKGLARWYAGRRCDIASLRGAYAEAGELAGQAGGPFYSKVAEQLQTPQGQRCLLPVSFVRQHHMTCAPATLTALSAFWGRPVAHLEVAEEICYDGTSYQAERAWAERNGWLVREFTADWATSCALIDSGLPFTLSVQYTGSGHLQAVVGYDQPRGTLLIRDPGQAQFGECLAESLFATQRASGPRGMVLLPADQAYRLEGLEFPERHLWDNYYRLLCALEVHRREDALRALADLQATAPEHRLYFQAQRALAWYDGREMQVLEATEALLQHFPDDSNLILSKASSLSMLQSRGVQLAWLEQHCQARWSDPLIVVRYANLLGDGGGQGATVQYLLNQALRQAPGQAPAWNALASLRWGEGMREQSCELYRFAACLHAANEGYSNQYFRALRCLGRTEEGMHFLRQRHQQLGALAAGPSITLSECLEEVGDAHGARDVLEQALQVRPNDPELLLGLADFYGRSGELELNYQLLLRAETLSRRGAWLRAAVIYSQRSGGDIQQALLWCQEAAELDPLNLSLHRLYAQLLRQSAGEEAVDAYVEALAQRFEHHAGIAEFAVERAQRRSLEAAEAALRRLLHSHPQNAWALRELAVVLARLGRSEEALSLCRQVLVIDPQDTYCHSTHGFVLLQAGQREEAQDAFRKALQRSADNEYASNMLLDTCAGQDDVLQSLDYVHAELVRQVTFGEGWMAYQQQAQKLLDPRVLLEQLGEALRQRPDLWQLWVVVARQQALEGHVEQAEALLQSAVERFPLMPRLALERAQLQKNHGQYSECRATLQESFRINPLWTPTVRLYVESLLDEGDNLAEAEALLNRVLSRAPDNHELRAYLSYVQGEREAYGEAVLEAERILRDEPGNAWVWNQLGRYSVALDDAGRPLRLAHELVKLRAGDADAWLALAEHEQNTAGREDALREALRFNPRHRGAHEKLLDLLLKSERFDELHELLAAPCWGGATPVELAVFGPRATYKNGKHDAALDELRQLLERHRNSFDAWRELADWQDSAGHYSAYVESAREMVRLEPKLAISHGFLGHALLLNEQSEQALLSFSQAFRLDPGYTFAGLNEFDLQLKYGCVDDCRAVLARLLEAPNASQPSILMRALDFAQAHSDRPLKQRVLEYLCRDDDNAGAWADVLKRFVAPARDPELWPIVEKAASEGALHHAAVLFWLKHEDARWLPGSLWKGFSRLLLNDPKHAAKHAMLDLLAERENANSLLVRTLQTCREAIRNDGMIWGMASYALANQGLYTSMLYWLTDWKQRTDIPAWGLNNLALGLRATGRDELAADVSHKSLEQMPENHEAMIWLAADAARQTDMQTLRVWQSRYQGAQLRPYFACMQHMLDGYAEAVEHGDSARAVRHFSTAKAVARGGSHSAYRRLRRDLAYRLAFGRCTHVLLAPWRYLQLRFE